MIEVFSFFLGTIMAAGDEGLPPSDFLAFSASSTPKADRFQPKRGKRNGYDNWQRFGHFENRGQQQNNYFYSSPNWTQHGANPHRGWRGSPGGHFRGQHGGRYAPRGGQFQRGGRGNRGYHHESKGMAPGTSWFHPSMVEDPWASFFDTQSEVDLLNASESNNDSLMPQVGDSFIDPAPDVPDSIGDNSEDLSTYSFTEPSNEESTSVEKSNEDTISIEKSEIDSSFM